ncbi:ribosome biogenesis factor YjgA [Litoribrevibacter euphylliae]|uniref:Dual-action ribosomal maturation protein DarP n=1 Tax=Litoribrevibacter euphylliae TaxID=1834034 RepID=A0ABV7H9T3_9GAMM
MARKRPNETEEFEDDIELISKSELKREATRLQNIGKELIEQKQSILDQLELTPDLMTAIQEHKRLKQREAKRRHLQYIGKLMREVDADTIEQALEKQRAGSDQQIKHLHSVERWRDRLIESDDNLTLFINEYDTDIQQLRQLVRNARKDQKEQKNRGHSKKLFQWLKDAIPF